MQVVLLSSLKVTSTLVRAKGKVKPGKAVSLEAGDLPCKKVVHAVGPRWSNGLHGEALFCSLRQPCRC